MNDKHEIAKLKQQVAEVTKERDIYAALLTSRQLARLKGEPRYLGEPCSIHPESMRYTADKKCVICHRIRVRTAQNKAYSKVKQAILNKKLIRQPCEICGDKISQAHHDSYLPADRLKVRWLCVEHHASWHNSNKPTYPEEGLA